MNLGRVAELLPTGEQLGPGWSNRVTSLIDRGRPSLEYFDPGVFPAARDLLRSKVREGCVFCDVTYFRAGIPIFDAWLRRHESTNAVESEWRNLQARPVPPLSPDGKGVRRSLHRVGGLEAIVCENEPGRSLWMASGRWSVNLNVEGKVTLEEILQIAEAFARRLRSRDASASVTPEASSPGEPSAWHTVKAIGDLYTPVRRVHTNRVGLSRAFAKPDGSHAWYTITNAESVPILLWNVRVQVMTNANGGGLEGWETVSSDYPEGVSRLLPGTTGDFRVALPSRAPWRVALLYTAQSLDGRPIPDFPPHLQGDHELTGRTEESLFRASLRIAGAQIPVTRDIQANTQAILRALEFAAREKADVLLTPEGSLSGYTSRFDTAATDRAMEVIVQRAREAKIGLVLGTCFADADGRRFDAQRFYGAGGEYLGFHSKILLCRRVADPLHRGEVADFQTTPLRTFNLGGIKVGGLVCNDMWANPEWTPMADRHLARQLAAMGARLIFLSVNSGVEEGEDLALHRAFHESNLQLRARNAGTWVAVANAADPSGRLDVTCPSGIVSPEGRWVLRADPKGEQFFVHTIDFDRSW